MTPADDLPDTSRRPPSDPSGAEREPTERELAEQELAGQELAGQELAEQEQAEQEQAGQEQAGQEQETPEQATPETPEQTPGVGDGDPEGSTAGGDQEGDEARQQQRREARRKRLKQKRLRERRRWSEVDGEDPAAANEEPAVGDQPAVVAAGAAPRKSGRGRSGRGQAQVQGQGRKSQGPAKPGRKRPPQEADDELFDENILPDEEPDAVGTGVVPLQRGPKNKGPGPRQKREEAFLDETGQAEPRPQDRLVVHPDDHPPGYRPPPPAPGRGALQWLRMLLPALLVVGLPTLLGIYYYGVLASDRYYTETRISVRSPGGSATPSLMSSALGGLQLGTASIEADSISEFVTSHDAVSQLMEEVDLRTIFGREDADFISRLPADASFEDLVEHFRSRVTVTYNEASGIITIGVQTYRPQDSSLILYALNGISERLVNAFNRRAERDALSLARSEVERAEARMAQARSELLRFRLANQDIDPEQRSGSILAIIAGLEAEYSDVSAQLSERGAFMDPGSLQISALRNRLTALEEQIRTEERRLTGTEGPYANVLNDYEMLMLERELARQDYTSAITSLEGARVEAQRQQVYLVTIVEPHDADAALFPRRAENIGLIFLASLLILLIGRLIVTGIQDHLMN